MCPADCGVTPASRKALNWGCTPAELGDLAGSAAGQSGFERHVLAESTMLSELECGLKRLGTEQC